MQSSRQLLALFIVVPVLAALGGGLFSKRQVFSRADAELSQDPVVTAYSKAVELIDENFAGEADKEAMSRGAVAQMLHTLDPHSNFFNRQEFNEMQDEQSSRFYGIGVTVNQRSGRLYILGVGQGLPAEKAGLRYGDAIIAVDGKPATGWGQADALKHIRGSKRGVSVEITVERVGEAKPLTVRIARDEIPYPSVRNHFMLRPEIGYIALTGGFNQATSEELNNALADLKKQGMGSLVLDLRRNPGGLLRQAVQVAEIFLANDTEIVTVKSSRAAKQVYRSDNPRPETLSLVVLIDGETASASEIVAGAMQDQDRGLVVGEPSFGKGLVQTVFRLPAGTGLMLTTAKYYTASGRSIQRGYAGVSLYDYGLGRKARAAKPTSKEEVFYTPTRREVRSGGGITPDVLVASPGEDWRMRDACFEFARYLVAGEIVGLPEYKLGRSNPTEQLRGPLGEPMLAAFRLFLRERPELRHLESNLNLDPEYARRRLRAEVITAAYGVEAGEQALLENDPQTLKAIEELPKSKLLSERARLVKTPNKTAH
jgi:carboxyl-terminal processing protease